MIRNKNIKKKMKNLKNTTSEAVKKANSTKRVLNKVEGITLVALVITVIIMLILAGVALSLITGKDGVFAGANRSAQKYKDASQEEADKLDSLLNELYKYSSVLPEISETPELPKPETEFTQKANGVIDIVWLNTDNTVRTEEEGPLSPKEHLGGLTAVKYSSSEWVDADANNGSNEWYNYEAQAGNTETEGTSHWANAKIEKDGKTAYFVWIPRYAYKITYFDTADNANAYRANGSTEGIIGYSTIQGIIDATGEEAKVVSGTEPTNVTGTVKTSGYTEYIPHPAFEFNGPEAGIWVGKYEASGTRNDTTSITSIEIKGDTTSLRGITASAMFEGSKTMKDTYGLSGDTHMMKNIEWGAVAYLTESKYGRNGTEVTQNTDSNWITGGGTTGSKLQSSTGNEYGIYDLSGGAEEYTAGYIDNGTTTYISSLVDEKEDKYKDVYEIGASDDNESNYQANKGMKGDAVYETSTAGTGSTSWHGDYSNFPNTSTPAFERGGSYLALGTNSGAFYFDGNDGGNKSGLGFHVVFIS